MIEFLMSTTSGTHGTIISDFEHGGYGRGCVDTTGSLTPGTGAGRYADMTGKGNTPAVGIDCSVLTKTSSYWPSR